MRETLDQLGHRHRRGLAQLVGERVIGHLADSVRVGAAVQAHPLLVRATPFMNAPVSLVGGAVRDALLAVEQTEDLDLVVEGDALALAERLGHELNVRVVSHGRFGTAYLELPHDRWIDIVMARRETYAHPGALPDVVPGTLADDLARRDFTINAMAYRLTGTAAGELVDPHDGRRDLHAGLIRILRPDSFVEDPTRLLRAVRYAARLGFRLEPETEAAGRASAPSLDPTSARVGDELRRLLKERTAAPAMRLAADLGVPWIRPDEGWDALFAAVSERLTLPGAPRVEEWAIRLGLAVDADVLERVAVDGWARGVAVEATWAPRLAERLGSVALRPSEVDAILKTAKPATAVVVAAQGNALIPRWWSTMRDVRLAISGEDLVAAGIRPGPAIGRGLAVVRAAVLDGDVPDARDRQLDLALRVVRDAA